jgi:hypothetical protein
MRRPAVGPTQTPIQRVRGSFPEVKLLGRYVNHMPATIPKVLVIKNERTSILTVRIHLHGVNRATLLPDFTVYTTLKVGRVAQSV